MHERESGMGRTRILKHLRVQERREKRKKRCLNSFIKLFAVLYAIKFAKLKDPAEKGLGLHMFCSAQHLLVAPHRSFNVKIVWPVGPGRV